MGETVKSEVNPWIFVPNQVTCGVGRWRCPEPRDASPVLADAPVVGTEVRQVFDLPTVRPRPAWFVQYPSPRRDRRTTLNPGRRGQPVSITLISGPE